MAGTLLQLRCTISTLQTPNALNDITSARWQHSQKRRPSLYTVYGVNIGSWLVLALNDRFFVGTSQNLLAALISGNYLVLALAVVSVSTCLYVVGFSISWYLVGVSTSW